MSFVRTDPNRAGPTALGILIPQGARTLVILRPRALEWDLLPARWDGDRACAPEFCTFERDEAVGVARKVITSLEAAVLEHSCPVQTFGDPAAQQLQIWMRAGEHVWIACSRSPGQAYQPIHFSTIDDARQAAEKLVAFVWPAADARQEYYFNTQNLG
jgi:hypothetical protein